MAAYVVFADVKSKLVVWIVIPAVMLANQREALPFDVWANGLANHEDNRPHGALRIPLSSRAGFPQRLAPLALRDPSGE